MNEWEQVTDTVQRAIAFDYSQISCSRIKIFQLLARDGQRQQAVDEIKEFLKQCEKQEPKNPELFYKCSQLFARVAGGNEIVLQKTMDILKKAIQLNGTSSPYLAENAYQQTLMHEYVQAFQMYQKAAELDESNTEPLYGMIYCRLKQNLLEDVQSQLDFLTELENSEKTAFHTYLEAMLIFRRDGLIDQSVELLNQCLKLHIAEAKKVPIGFEFYIKLNSAFLLELSQEFLQHCPPSKRYTNAESMPGYLIKGTKLLETLTRQTPGIIEANMLLARAKWFSNDVTSSITALNSCTTMAPDIVEPYILKAQIYKDDGNLTAAFSSLEQALAENFLVREHPYFAYTKAQLEICKKEYQQAFTTIEAAFEITAIKNKQSMQKTKSFLRFGEEELAKMYAMMVEVCDQLKRPDDAKKYMQKAIAEFVNTPFEVTIMLANADMALKAGDVKKALNMLKKVPITSPYFKDARIKMGDIYLIQLMDRRHYAKCYMEIVKAKESPEHYRLAGDAMMRIQEPEEAIELYEKALQNSTDTTLVRDIGRALVMTHDYKKAIQYYEGALDTNASQHALREDLANLRIKLGQYTEAKAVIDQGINLLESEEKSIKNIKYHVGLLLASTKLMRAESGAGKYGKVELLKGEYGKTIEKQLSLINKLKELGSSDALEREKEYVATLYFELADYYEHAENNRDSAKEAYVDALRQCDSHKPSLLALAKLLSQKGELDACASACNRLLKIDPSNEEGTYLAAQTMFLRDSPEQGLGIFKSLLAIKPDNFHVLASFVSFAKKLGRVQETTDYIDNAAKIAGRSNEPGIVYVKGLYERLQGNTIEALKLLNGARGDRSYSKEVLVIMIDIYLNLDRVDWCINEQSQEAVVSLDNIKAASSLVDELERVSINDPTVVVYRSYCEMFKRDKAGLELANKYLTDLLKQRTEYIPGIVALSVLKFMQKKAVDVYSRFNKFTRQRIF